MDCFIVKDCYNFKKFILFNNRGLLLVYWYNILFRLVVFMVWYVVFFVILFLVLIFFILIVLEVDNNVGFCRGWFFVWVFFVCYCCLLNREGVGF